MADEKREPKRGTPKVRVAPYRHCPFCAAETSDPYQTGELSLCPQDGGGCGHTFTVYSEDFPLDEEG